MALSFSIPSYSRKFQSHSNVSQTLFPFPLFSHIQTFPFPPMSIPDYPTQGRLSPLTPWSKFLLPFPLLSLPPPLRSPPLPLPFPLPSLPSSLPSPPLRSRPPLLRLGGLGERFSSPSGSGQSPAAKRYLVNFRLKISPLVATVFRCFSGNETSNWDDWVAEW